MKLIRPLVVGALLTIYSIATYGSISVGIPIKTSDLTLFDIDFNNIFFHGEDEETLFIDFQAINNPLVEISLRQDQKVFLVDRVADLPKNTIYELNLDIIRPGDYVLELVTQDGIKIQKDIKVY